jgi:amino acid transporter
MQDTLETPREREPGKDGGAPHPSLKPVDVAAVIVGLVIGAGIFKAPALVAGNVSSGPMMMAAWLAGGGASLLGALCYAELACAYPSAGGEYSFLTRAYGRGAGFLFAWARLVILQTGSIALLAFVIGDYASEIRSLGSNSAAIYAAFAIVLLTILNVAGLRIARRFQNVLTLVMLAGLALVIAAGLGLAPPSPPVDPGPPPDPGNLGLAMIFVFLTYGGWNEAAYVSAEIHDVRRNMPRVLVGALVLVAAVYLLANLSYLKVLGLQAMGRSEAVAADAMRRAVGDNAAGAVSALVVLATITSMNVTILTGARSNYALARDFRAFTFIKGWSERTNAPVKALLLQGAIALSLVGLGSAGRSGFEAMVRFVSPVFWLFFLMITLSIFVLRRKDPSRRRPFRVPGYPATPLLFAMTCGYMLYSSLAHASRGALLGLLVLASGLPLLASELRSGGRGRPRRMERSHPMRELAYPAAAGVLVLSAVVAGSLVALTPVLDPSAHWRYEESSHGSPALDVPYLPTPPAVVDAMLDLAGLDGDGLLYDLGSGDGRIVIAGATRCGARGVGIEIDPALVRQSVANARNAGVTDRVRFIRGDLFEADLREATAVTLYLFDEVNLRLRPKLLRELRPGTPVVSHQFGMGDWRPDRTVEIEGRKVHLWIVPANVEGRWKVSVEGRGDQGLPAPTELLLEQQYQAVRGWAFLGGEPYPVEGGRVKGDGLELRIRPRNAGVAPALLFRGRVKSDLIEGSVAGDDGRPVAARWTANKVR